MDAQLGAEDAAALVAVYGGAQSLYNAYLGAGQEAIPDLPAAE